MFGLWVLVGRMSWEDCRGFWFEGLRVFLLMLFWTSWWLVVVVPKGKGLEHAMGMVDQTEHFILVSCGASVLVLGLHVFLLFLSL